MPQLKHIPPPAQHCLAKTNSQVAQINANQVIILRRSFEQPTQRFSEPPHRINRAGQPSRRDIARN